MTNEANAPADVNTVEELELTEVSEKGLPPKAVLALGAVCVLALLYAIFNAITGNLGLPVLGMLALGGGGLFYVVKQIQGAEDGELLAVKKKLASSGGGKAVKPSVRTTGSLLDI